jgi:hypothetical protein
MTSKQTDASIPFFKVGSEQTDAMIAMQKDLLETYEQASSASMARMKSEVDLWSGLGAKLMATRSIPEALETYQKCVAQRMQMAAEDGRRLFEECQKIAQKITRSMSNGRSAGSS